MNYCSQAYQFVANTVSGRCCVVVADATCAAVTSKLAQGVNARPGKTVDSRNIDRR